MGVQKTKGYIEHPKVLAEIIKYWNKFPQDKKPSVTEIITHLNSKGLDQASRSAVINYLTDNTSYGKLTKNQKKRLATDSKNRLIETGQKDLKTFIRQNAYKYDDVDKFEQAILKHFDQPKYRSRDLTKAYSTVSLAGRKNIGSVGGFIYNTANQGKGLKLEGFGLEEYEEFQPKITKGSGTSYKTSNFDSKTRQPVLTGQHRPFRQMLAMAIMDNNPKVKKKLDEAIKYSNYITKLSKEKKFKPDPKIKPVMIDDVIKGMGPASFRTGTSLTKFLTDKNFKFTAARTKGFQRKAISLQDFVEIYGPEKGPVEFKFFDETLRKYFRPGSGMAPGQFIKEHSVPRQLIRMGKVPAEFAAKVRGATPLVNAVAKTYQDKIIRIIKSANDAAAKGDFEETAKLSGKARKIAKDFKTLTKGYPLPFSVDEKGRFVLLDDQPLNVRTRGSKFVGPVARLGLEFTDSIRINNELVKNFKTMIASGVPEEDISKIFGREAMATLGPAYRRGTLQKLPMTGQETELANIFKDNPKEGIQAVERMFKKDPINFLKNTRIGKAVTRALSEGNKFKLYDFVGTKTGGKPVLNYRKVVSAIKKGGGLPMLLIGGGLGYGAIKEISEGRNPFSMSVQAAEVKQPEVGTPIKYDKNVGAIVSENTDQPATQNQILTYIKDNPLKVTAGTSLAFAAEEVPGAYKAARKLGRGKVRSALGITGALKPVLTTIGTPAMTALFEVPFMTKQLEEGKTATEILTDPLEGPALGLAFMEPFSKSAGVIRGAPKRTMAQGLRNYFNLSNVGQARPGLTSKVLRLGMSPRMIAGASRFLGIPGLLLGAGLSGYDAYKNYQNQEGFLYNLLNRDE